MKICGQTLEEQINNARKLGKSLKDYQKLLREIEIRNREYDEWAENMTEEEFYRGWTEDEVRHHKEKLNEPFIQTVTEPEEKTDAQRFEELF